MVHKDLKPADVSQTLNEMKGRFKPGAIKPRTNKGVQLGMSISQVQRILGKPTKTMWSKKFNAQELIYRRETPKSSDGISTAYSNYYLFRGGKLYYIELAEDAIGGG